MLNSDDRKIIIQWLNSFFPSDKWKIKQRTLPDKNERTMFARWDIYFNDVLICYKWVDFPLGRHTVLKFMEENEFINFICKIKEKK